MAFSVKNSRRSTPARYYTAVPSVPTVLVGTVVVNYNKSQHTIRNNKSAKRSKVSTASSNELRNAA